MPTDSRYMILMATLSPSVEGGITGPPPVRRTPEDLEEELLDLLEQSFPVKKAIANTLATAPFTVTTGFDEAMAQALAAFVANLNQLRGQQPSGQIVVADSRYLQTSDGVHRKIGWAFLGDSGTMPWAVRLPSMPDRDAYVGVHMVVVDTSFVSDAVGAG